MNRYSLQFKTSEAEYRATVRAFVRCIPMAIQLGKITPALRHNLQRFAGTFDDAEFAATLYSAMQPSEIDPNAPRLIRSAPAAALPGAEAGTPDGEEVRRIVRDALRRPLSSTEAAYLNRLAALTSEVRALREERDDWQESARIYVRSNRELRAQLRAARLASPSPTGAPAEQQKN